MIDSKLQAELRTRFNPDGSELRRAQLRMLEMLKYIDKICTENNLKYWLSSGTCLGAVRHGGFIPWDDDVDIEMFPKDFKQFKKIVDNDHGSNYVLQNQFNDIEYRYPFSKLRDLNSEIEEIIDFDEKYKYRGIFIDVFIMSPSNSKFLRRLSTSINAHLLELAYRSQNNNIIRLCKLITCHILNPISQCLQSIHSRGRLRHLIGCYLFKSRLKKDVQEQIRIPFENIELPVPINYGSYLKSLYGNYETLPDLNKIKPHIIKIRYKN